MKMLLFISIILMNTSWAGKVEITIGSKVNFYQGDESLIKVVPGLECYGEEKSGNSRSVHITCNLNGSYVGTASVCHPSNDFGYAMLNINLKNKTVVKAIHHCNGLSIQ